MANFSGNHDLFFISGDSQTLAVVSSGGATTSTAAFGTQTRAFQVVCLAPVSSTAGVRVKVISPADSVVSSTAGALVPLAWVQTFKCLPGQRVTVISNNEVAATAVITELTN